MWEERNESKSQRMDGEEVLSGMNEICVWTGYFEGVQHQPYSCISFLFSQSHLFSPDDQTKCIAYLLHYILAGNIFFYISFILLFCCYLRVFIIFLSTDKKSHYYKS